MQGERRAILVVDLAFGDCGKGAIVDALVRRHRAGLVVRFNGGPQAGHNVVTPDGRHHTFSQFGSGTFIPGTRTLCSRFMVVEPYAMLNEEAHLRTIGVSDAFDRLRIDRTCPVITPPQQCANRLRELARDQNAHGTCGAGVGETMRDLLDRPELILRAGELADGTTVRRKLGAIRDRKVEELGPILSDLHGMPRARPSIDALVNAIWIDDAVDLYRHVAERATLVDDRTVRELFQSTDVIVFEGAQGVLLDETYGFHPHTTWSTTTFANADALLDAADFEHQRIRLGVLRSYFTRHGRGPFVTDDAVLRERLLEPHNQDAGWQGRFRVGRFDVVAARYAISAVGRVDGLALTHLDRLPLLPPEICTAYRVAECVRALAHDLVPSSSRGPEGAIHDLHVARSTDLVRQEKLTRLLCSCAPVLRNVATDSADAFVDEMERELGVPIWIRSAGPAAGDKARCQNPGRTDEAFNLFRSSVD